jgi:hypothetical protein
LEFLRKYISLDDDRDILTGNSEVDRRRATMHSQAVFSGLVACRVCLFVRITQPTSDRQFLIFTNPFDRRREPT